MEKPFFIIQTNNVLPARNTHPKIFEYSLENLITVVIIIIISNSYQIYNNECRLWFTKSIELNILIYKNYFDTNFLNIVNIRI